MWQIFLRGGFAMWPLLFCSILALAIVLDRLWFFFVGTRGENEDLVSQALAALSGGRRLEAMQIIRKEKGVTNSILSAALAHADEPAQFVQEAMARAGRDELVRMQRGLGTLEAIVSVAPLLGLLGTVTGIIRTFNVIGGLQGLQSPAEVAPGIAEALFTTAFGLMIATPAQFFSSIFNAQVERRVAQINNRAGQVLLALGRGGERVDR
ncbi:MAG: MotA/TolQ/ExbB proton channel family protein [Chitinophagales bacterium]